jgi:hypothetical protein
VTRALVTHADEPIGRRVVKTLYHDADVETILAVGDGPAPRAFDRFLAGTDPRVVYARVDLAKHRPVSDLFHSARFREAAIDTLIHLPRHGAPAAESAPLVSGLSERTAEARLVLQHCLEVASIENLVALGSAFVYRLPPGNANRLHERSELDLDPDVAPEIRSWIDCDMLFHGEIHNDRLRVVLLRAPTVVAAGGYVYMNPLLAGRRGQGRRPGGAGGGAQPQVRYLQRGRLRGGAALGTRALDGPTQPTGPCASAGQSFLADPDPRPGDPPG